MKRKLCKAIGAIVLVGMMCLEVFVQVYASDATMITDIKLPETPGMQPIDLSEEALLNAQIVSCEKDINLSETECVSVNGISINSTPVSAENTTYSTLEDAADYLRQKMVKRTEYVSFRVDGSKDTALKSIVKIFNKACEYDLNGKPDEGDYLYWHMKAIDWWNITYAGNGVIDISMGLQYRTDASEERYVTRKVNRIIKKLDLKSSSLNEYEKIRAIYDYIMDTVEYDYYHYEADRNYNYMYTTYAALADGTAVCQAYATLFYRLCEEIGISARVICGNDDVETGKPTHGWNIVKIGKFYYNVDATWDDANAPTHTYFLKNKKDFKGHQRNKVNSGSAYDKQFPMTSVSYLQPEDNPVKKLLDLSNIDGILETTEGAQESLSADDKIKIILFANPGEMGIVSCLDVFYDQKSVKSGKYDVIIADIYDDYENQETTPEEVMTKIMNRADKSSNYVYSSDIENAQYCLKQYAKLAGVKKTDVTSVVLIDASNRVRFFGNGLEAICLVDDIVSALKPEPDQKVMGVKVKQLKNNSVRISWDKYKSGVTYRIYRKVNTGKYYSVGTTTKTAFTDEVGPKKNYTYKIFVVRNGLDIAGSAQVSVKTKTILPKKGKTYTVDGYKYKVLKSTSKTKTVAFKGVSNKKLIKIIIPATVKIDGITYKVTEIAAKALNGNKKVKTVSIGSNVTKIGSKAFYKNSKLANIVIKSKKLKNVGSKALAGISGKAEIRVPSSKYKAYKKILKGKGQKSSVKIKK